MKHIAIYSAVLALLGSACSNPGKSDGETQSGLQSVSADAATIEARPIKAEKGSVGFALPAGFTDIKGFVVGSSSHLALINMPEREGFLGFKDMEAGSYDIILSAQKTSADGSRKAVGMRVSGVKVIAGEMSVLGSLEWKALIQLDGQVSLPGDSDPVGIVVAIPGTHYKANVASDGSYSFNDLPAGQHAIEIKHPSYHIAGVASKDYRTSESVPALRLLKSEIALPSGAFVIASDSISDAPQHVFLIAPKGMNLFRSGAESDLSQEPWQALRTSMGWNGSEPLFIQFSNQGTQQSAVFSPELRPE